MRRNGAPRGGTVRMDRPAKRTRRTEGEKVTAKIIDGKAIAQKLRERLKREVDDLKEKGITPGLAVILVGEDPASLTYVRNKRKACREIGIRSFLFSLPETVSEGELVRKIEELNKDEQVHGILVQLPLPSHVNPANILPRIHPMKDVDGFHPLNAGKLMAGEKTFIPCTPLGISVLLKEIGCRVEGKHAVVVGRSNIVGKPAGQLLLNMNATVTYCHSKTADLQKFTSMADILIVACGKPNLIGAGHVKEGAVVIDVGINRDESGRLTGDVNFEEVKEKAGFITPVPGGVGPMTITMLLSNTIQAAKQIHRLPWP
ncbi:Methylenetetrahydrofolate dehydrogenase (NADP+) [Caldibacillus debilis]|uniref:Bifunctional protein FolD n=1 Tax=Caldibacillus debilis TaxID=301148 RepID=A0A150M7I9_9BACI|nr:Methylenetetrahydrofolate dehydrogenase (NADP+) [Caldibacillus debilis]